ncbi:MAG TPA: sugar phosphorylase [Anaerolineae bacterium]
MYDRLYSIIAGYHFPPSTSVGGVSQRDAILITYGDQVRAPNEPPLRTLAGFTQRHLDGLISTIHILPFYPSSSDDGFSVIDYYAVDSALGTWDDVQRIGAHVDLMFDAVINHTSACSDWFQRYLKDDPAYRDWFIAVDPATDFSRVVRPRALPLLTRFDMPGGPKHVWTTFSDDQIDLNYANPDVLLKIIDLLLFYVSRGARFLRLDAIAYLWKEIGTPCTHLPQTHHVIQLFRAVLDRVAPHVALITETNVPHADNIAYFGDGFNEAQLVYNFALPPLVLYSIHTADARALSRWAASLSLPSDRTTFLNFLASHDGIGLNPVRDILPDGAIEMLVDRAQAHGGLVSMKSNADGTRSPYELNINYFDALNDPNAHEPIEMQVDRFMAAQAIMLALVGVPGIYAHSLLGSRGWPGGVTQTGRYRTINRQKLDRAQLERELSDPDSLRSRVFSRYARLLRARAAHPAFDPIGHQRVLEGNTSVFAVLRRARDDSPAVLCLHNVSTQPQPCEFELNLPLRAATDVLTGQVLSAHPGRRLAVRLAPYQVMWLSNPPAGRNLGA